MTRQEAVVIRVNEDGVAYARANNRVSGFPFRKIVGYHGETAKELGLAPGVVITVEYVDGKDNEVNSVLIKG